MTTPVETVDRDATISEAAEILYEHRIGSLVVGQQPIEGILTETDVVGSIARETDPSAPVSAHMSEPVVTIRPEETVRVAGERMGHNGVKKLPVTEDGRPIGIITTTDLAHFLPQFRVGMAHQTEPEVNHGEFE